jgi:hypothetical protein
VSALNPRQFPPVEQRNQEGTPGNRSHITRVEHGHIPTSAIANLPGVMGERPGEHRNKRGADWDKFRDDVRTNGVQRPVFITVDPGEGPKISEGNHRRDAAVATNQSHVPVEIRYFGHSERENDNWHGAAQ